MAKRPGVYLCTVTGKSHLCKGWGLSGNKLAPRGHPAGRRHIYAKQTRCNPGCCLYRDGGNAKRSLTKLHWTRDPDPWLSEQDRKSKERQKKKEVDRRGIEPRTFPSSQVTCERNVIPLNHQPNRWKNCNLFWFMERGN